MGIYGNSSDDLYWQLSTLPQGATPTVNFMYSMSSNVKSYRSGQDVKEINIYAEVLIDGTASNNSYNLIATVLHDTTGYGNVSFSGAFIATQVESAR